MALTPGGSRTKGQGGERELCKLLSQLLKLEKPLERNVDQTRIGGADIVDLKPFAIEVKRQQTLQINTWLAQAVSQATKRNPIPVLVYRKNGGKWTVMLPAGVAFKKRFTGAQKEWLTMSLEAFVTIAKVLKY